MPLKCDNKCRSCGGCNGCDNNCNDNCKCKKKKVFGHKKASSSESDDSSECDNKCRSCGGCNGCDNNCDKECSCETKCDNKCRSCGGCNGCDNNCDKECSCKKKHKTKKCLTPKVKRNKKCTSVKRQEVYNICSETKFCAKAVFDDSIVVNKLESCKKISFCSFTKFDDCVKFKGNCKFLGDVIICDGTCLQVTKITSCCDNPVKLDGDFYVKDDLIVSNIKPYIPDFGINIDGDVNVNGVITANSIVSKQSSLSFGNTVLQMSQINPCSSTAGVIVNSLVSNSSSLGIIKSINGTNVTMTHPLVVEDQITSTELRSCLGVTTNLLTSCSGNEITCESNLLIEEDIKVKGTVYVNTISSFDSDKITFKGSLNISSLISETSSIAVNSDLSLCNHSLYVSEIVGCNGIINLVGIVNIDTLTTSSVTACAGITTDTLNSCSGTLRVLSNDTIFEGPVTLSSVSCDDLTSKSYDLSNVSLGSGASLIGSLKGPGGNVRSFKSLTSNSIMITNTDETVNLEVHSLTSGYNLGIGANVYESTTGNVMHFRSITNNDGKLNISNDASSVIIDLNQNIVTGTNLGTGATVYKDASNDVLNFNTLVSVSPELVITNVGNEIQLNSSYINNAATGIFSAPISIVPRIWTSYINPTITGGADNFSVTSNGIQGVNQSFKAVFTFHLNMTNGPNSLASIGATYVLIRFVNAGNIISNITQPVFDDPNVNDTFTNSFILEYGFYGLHQPNNAHIQIWHNGTSNWTGATQATYIINNV